MDPESLRWCSRVWEGDCRRGSGHAGPILKKPRCPSGDRLGPLQNKTNKDFDEDGDLDLVLGDVVGIRRGYDVSDYNVTLHYFERQPNGSLEEALPADCKLRALSDFRRTRLGGASPPISKEISLKRTKRGKSGERFYPVRARRFQSP